MPKFISQICSGVAGVAVGAGVTAAIILNQPTVVDQEFAQLKSMGFNGGVSEPGLDYIRVTVTNGDHICSARMRHLGVIDAWSATADNGDHLQQNRITPDDLKSWLNC